MIYLPDNRLKKICHQFFKIGLEEMESNQLEDSFYPEIKFDIFTNSFCEIKFTDTTYCFEKRGSLLFVEWDHLHMGYITVGNNGFSEAVALSTILKIAEYCRERFPELTVSLNESAISSNNQEVTVSMGKFFVIPKFCTSRFTKNLYKELRSCIIQLRSLTEDVKENAQNVLAIQAEHAELIEESNEQQ